MQDAREINAGRTHVEQDTGDISRVSLYESGIGRQLKPTVRYENNQFDHNIPDPSCNGLNVKQYYCFST